MQEWLRSLPILHRYLSDARYKSSLFLETSFALNLLYAAWEFFCGIYYRAFWFVTLGCYSLLLMLIR
ncbi:MAG: hypothetical protein LUG65_06210, partial [Clostridiales bacterium]|nr:hypothetical protein [Clostridiales bacterium]